MIDVAPKDLTTVREILKKYVPGMEVRAFGSRVEGEPRPYSDLDLTIVGKEEIERGVLSRLKEAFEESALPFRVDVMDWSRLTPEFQKIIARKYVVL